jgi:hypothetical protein
MEHIYEQPQFGENWFSYPKLYSRFVHELSSGSKIVEVGCWKGKSLAYLGVEIVNSGKSISVDAVDTWDALDTEYYHKTDTYVLSKSLYSLFLSNIARLSHIIKPVRMKSLDAANLYENESLDVVFIDACHEYECVKEDINAWLPKVKKNGYLSGHDYSSHPSVAQAVHELLGSVESGENCWVYRKP